MPTPLLADFALRLGCGLALSLLLTPWRLVPPAFFRTHCLVILGLTVLAALSASRAGGSGPVVAAAVGAAALSYLSAVAWGLGLPRVALPLTALVVAACGGALVAVTRPGEPSPRELDALTRLASAFLLGSALTAMLLGHHYLTAPAMSIDPLKRFVRFMSWGLAVRGALAAVGLGLWATVGLQVGSHGSPAGPGLFLAARWVMGLIGPAVAAWMTWKTVQIRSTQSATGILYIAVALVLFGELTAMALSGEARVAL